MKVYALDCGSLTAPMEAFIEGGEGMMTVPVMSFLIDHPRGKAVFDTGMPAGLRSNPDDAIGRYLAGIFKADGFTRAHDIDRQLESLGVDPGSIDVVINSHLHFDHCAGNHLLPNARIVVQRREVEAIRAEGPPKHGFYAGTMLDGRDVAAIDGEFDVFGDGTVTIVPTYGHTAGHQSVRLKCDGGETVLAGDCCYFHATLRDMKLPRFSHDREAHKQSIERLRDMEDRGVRVIAGHDPVQFAALARPPQAFLAG